MFQTIAPVLFSASGFDTSIANTAPATIPQDGTQTIFNITGIVQVLEIVGVVTTAIGSTAITLKISGQVGALTAVDVCGTGTITSLAAGGLLQPITSFATALAVGGIYGIAATVAPTSFVIGSSTLLSTLYITTSANDTGATQWYIRYRPLSAGATVTPAF